MNKSRVATIALVLLIFIIAFVMFRRISMLGAPKEGQIRRPPVERPVATSAAVEAPLFQPIVLPEPSQKASNKRPSDLPQILEPVGVGQTAWAIAAEKWQNVGRASLGAAIQSDYWAISGGDLEYLASSMVLDSDARALLEKLLGEVPSDIRSRYSTPETLASFFLTSIPALRSIAIGAAQDVKGMTGDKSVFVLTLEPEAEHFSGISARYRQSGDGQWLRVVQVHEANRWLQNVRRDKELSKSRVWNVSK